MGAGDLSQDLLCRRRLPEAGAALTVDRDPQHTDRCQGYRGVAEHAPDLAAKARQYLGGIVDFAIKKGLREDGRLLSLRGTVPTTRKGTSRRRSSPPTSTRLWWRSMAISRRSRALR